MKVKRNQRLRVFMNVACEKLGLQPETTRFTLGHKVFRPQDTAEVFGKRDSVVIHVERIGQARPEDAADAGAVGARDTGAFEVGDFVQVMFGKALEIGTPGTITGEGSRPGTYNVNFAFSSSGQQEVPDIPVPRLQRIKGRNYAIAVKRLREDPLNAQELLQQVKSEGEEIRKHVKAPVAAAAHVGPAINVGDFAELSINDEKGSGSLSWVPCTISSEGKESNTFNVHFLFAPVDYRDVVDVPASKLRKIEAKRYVDSVQRFRKDSSTAQMALRLAAREAKDRSFHSGQQAGRH